MGRDALSVAPRVPAAVASHCGSNQRIEAVVELISGCGRNWLLRMRRSAWGAEVTVVVELKGKLWTGVFDLLDLVA